MSLSSNDCLKSVCVGSFLVVIGTASEFISARTRQRMFLHDFLAMNFIIEVLIMGTNFQIQEAVYAALDAFAFWSLKEPQ